MGNLPVKYRKPPLQSQLELTSMGLEAFGNSIEADIRALLKAVADLMLRIDSHGTYLECIPGRVFSLYSDLDRLVGNTVHDMLPPDQAQKQMDHIERAMKKRNLQCYELQIPVNGKFLEFEACTVACGPNETLTVVRDITKQKRTEAELKRSQQQLRGLAYHVEAAREHERTSIAREMHDEMGQTITSLNWNLSHVQKFLQVGHPELAADVGVMIESVDQLLAAVHRMCAQLRPALLDDLGLFAACEWQVDQFQQRTGIACHCLFLGQDVELNPHQVTALFRILQEALTNVARHANATEVSAKLGQEQNYFVLQVDDNGRGIDDREREDPKSFGIIGIYERARMLGGIAAVATLPEGGTRVFVRIPLQNGIRWSGVELRRGRERRRLLQSGKRWSGVELRCGRERRRLSDRCDAY